MFSSKNLSIKSKKNVYFISLLCRQSVGVKIKQGTTKDSSLILDRYRQIAILEEVMLLQHEMNKKQADKKELSDKMKVLEKFVHDVKILFYKLTLKNFQIE